MMIHGGSRPSPPPFLLCVIAVVGSAAGGSPNGNLRRGVVECSGGNPCQQGDGGLIFPHEKNSAMYKTCASGGICHELFCPSGTVWSQTDLTCVHGDANAASTHGCNPGVCSSDPDLCSKGFYHACEGGDDNEKKFVQCDEHGGCFVRDCAPGTVWSQEDQTCVEVMGDVGHNDGGGGGGGGSSSNGANAASTHGCNPGVCSSDTDLCSKGFYHACEGGQDKEKKFVQCDEHGGCFVRDCAPGTIWSQDALTCVRLDDGDGGSSNGANTAPSHGCNPGRCSSDTDLCSKGFYHACEGGDDNEKKFVQCDAHGGCFVRDCAPGTIWSQDALTCVHPCNPGSCGDDPCGDVENNGYFHTCESDVDKFVQCDDRGGCFVKDCPAGTVWNQGVVGCVYDCDACGTNPCGNGEMYHTCNSGNQAVDRARYVQCDQWDGCFAMDCAPGTVWNQDVKTCVDDCSAALGECANPCVDSVIQADGYYHAMCGDETKYIQCDEWGGCSVMPCLEDHLWDNEVKQCVRDKRIPIVAPDNSVGKVPVGPTVCENGHVYSHEFKRCVQPCELPEGEESPCTLGNVEAAENLDDLKFEHPTRNKRFIQCETNGDCSIEDCPEGSKWVDNKKKCVSKDYDCGEGNRVDDESSGKGKGGKGKGGKSKSNDEDDRKRRYMKSTKSTKKSGTYRTWQKGCGEMDVDNRSSGGKGKGSSRSGKGKGKGGSSNSRRRR